MDDKKVEEVRKIAEEKFSDQFVRNHIRPVMKSAEYLLDYYPDACGNCVIAAVWLQDIVHDETGYDGERHHVMSARKSESILRELNVSSEDINKVTEAVRCHRFKGVPYPEKIEAKILFSANYMANSEEKTLFGKPVREVEEDRIKKRFLLPEAGTRYEDDRIDRLREKYGVEEDENEN